MLLLCVGKLYFSERPDIWSNFEAECISDLRLEEKSAQDVYKGLGLELSFIFNSPLPWCLWQLQMMLQGGFGDFRNLIHPIWLGRWIAQSIVNHTHGGNEPHGFILPHSKSLNTDLNIYFLSAFRHSLTTQSASKQQSNFKAKCRSNLRLEEKSAQDVHKGLGLELSV